MASSKKYLDKAGLNYLWQKIKLNFSDINHNHDGKYIDYRSNWSTSDAGKVATWLNDHTLSVGHTLGRDVPSTSKFVDETEFWAGDTKIVAGTTGSSTAVVLPYAAKDVDGVVTTTSTVTSVSGDAAYHPVPIINGVPYYHDTLHDTYSTTGTTSSITPAHGSTFTVIDGVTVSNGHVTGYNTKTVKLPEENANMVTTTGTLPSGNIVVGNGDKTVKNSGYSVGGSTITGATGKVATEQAVKAAIDALPMKGVTGPILSIDNKIIKTTLNLDWDSTNKRLGLKGTDGTVYDYIDASDFVKDGMIQAVGFYRYNASGATGNKWTYVSGDNFTIADGAYVGATDGHEYIVMKWNEDGPTANKLTFIDALGLVDDYTAGNGINITNRTVSVKVDNSTAASGNNTKVTLTAGASGLRAEVNLTKKADKVSGATAGDIATLDANGNLVDSGKKPSDYVERVTVIGSTGASGPTFAWNSTIVIGHADGKTFKFNTPDEPVNHEALNQTDIEEAISDANSYIATGATGPSWHAY